jgi:Domain of unknown function (DUF4304)
VKSLNGHEKPELAKAMDELQGKLRQFLKDKGFGTRGRAFNRATSDGLTQVVKLQMGSFDPPGTTYFAGLRENRYGKFAINLGVYVPEVAKHHGEGCASSFVQEYHCWTEIGSIGTAGLSARGVPPKATDILFSLDGALPL